MMKRYCLECNYVLVDNNWRPATSQDTEQAKRGLAVFCTCPTCYNRRVVDFLRGHNNKEKTDVQD